MSEYHIELTWRCSVCHHVNRGRDLACAECGDPRQDHEPYEMPRDLEAAPKVEDPALVVLAAAGPNWRCQYCGSSTRSISGECGHCGGGRRADRSADSSEPPPPPPPLARDLPFKILILAIGAFCSATIMLLIFAGVFIGVADESLEERPLVSAAPPKITHHDLDVTTGTGRYSHAINVERWTLLDYSGFRENIPASATSVKKDGTHLHHVDRVAHGTKTETYTEYETQWSTETYSDRESCGESCTDRPQSCSRSCTNNKNGFATCRDVCTGGGRSCTTKYCSVTKTRQVSRQVPVSRTRTVPNYVDEPRYADWFTWKDWDWRADRTVEHNAEGFVLAWPTEEEVHLGKGLAAGEKERGTRAARYEVELVDTAGARHPYHPRTADEYLKFEHAQCRIRVFDSSDSILFLSQPTASARPALSAAPVTSVSASAAPSL
ncbi:MAG: hypothetical protein U0271_14830 [Polyangiaceae bacterium]